VAKSKTGRAIELYQKGNSFAEIGRRLGISASTARRWIKADQLDDKDDGRFGPPDRMDRMVLDEGERLPAPTPRMERLREIHHAPLNPRRVGFFERLMRALCSVLC